MAAYEGLDQRNAPVIDRKIDPRARPAGRGRAEFSRWLRDGHGRMGPSHIFSFHPSAAKADEGNRLPLRSVASEKIRPFYPRSKLSWPETLRGPGGDRHRECGACSKRFKSRNARSGRVGRWSSRPQPRKSFRSSVPRPANWRPVFSRKMLGRTRREFCGAKFRPDETFTRGKLRVPLRFYNMPARLHRLVGAHTQFPTAPAKRPRQTVARTHQVVHIEDISDPAGPYLEGNPSVGLQIADLCWGPGHIFVRADAEGKRVDSAQITIYRQEVKPFLL